MISKAQVRIECNSCGHKEYVVFTDNVYGEQQVQSHLAEYEWQVVANSPNEHLCARCCAQMARMERSIKRK